MTRFLDKQARIIEISVEDRLSGVSREQVHLTGKQRKEVKA